MGNPEIKHLFKYCPIGKNQLSALAQRKIWYSKPAGFNDPFDTEFYVREGGGKSKKKLDSQKISDETLLSERTLNKLLDNFKESIRNLGILSLASSNNNLLMWSHYASAHKGMCLEFKRNNHTALADDKTTKPMRYNYNFPSIQATLILSETDLFSDKIRILHTKSKHWEYEQEWRHIVEQGDKLYPWPAALTSIYFGCKTEMSDINLVKSIIDDSKVKYYQGGLFKRKFGVRFAQI